VNCPFYFKIGACRNGDRCNRMHSKPERSSVVLLPHLYPATADTLFVGNDEDWDDEEYQKAQEHMEVFYEEVFLELCNYGEIEDMVVVDNVSDHMVGNVYVKYQNEDDAAKAVQSCEKRFYGSRLMQAEFSPVTDFREARCRAFYETRCARGGFCNFMHLKHCPKAIKRRIMKEMYAEHPDFKNPNPTTAAAEPPPAKKQKMGDEERKAMVAQWNKDRFKAILPPGAPQPMVIPPPPSMLVH